MDFATLPNLKSVVVARDVSNLTFQKVETAVGRVSFFDIHSHRPGPEFGVRYDQGGKRLCLSRDGATVVCGCYDVYGLGAYDVAGVERWRRKDLKGVQFVQNSPGSITSINAALLNGGVSSRVPAFISWFFCHE